jgi:hypothetical protein
MKRGEKLSMIRLIGLWRGLSQSVRDKFKGKNVRGKQFRSKSRLAQSKESRSNAKDVECYYCHKKGNYKRFYKLMKQDLEDKKNQKGSADSVNVANDESDDSEVSKIFFQFPQVQILS